MTWDFLSWDSSPTLRKRPPQMMHRFWHLCFHMSAFRQQPMASCFYYIYLYFWVKWINLEQRLQRRKAHFRSNVRGDWDGTPREVKCSAKGGIFHLSELLMKCQWWNEMKRFGGIPPRSSRAAHFLPGFHSSVHSSWFLSAHQTWDHVSCLNFIYLSGPRYNPEFMNTGRSLTPEGARKA